jgi:pilus assembly protein CpaE
MTQPVIKVLMVEDDLVAAQATKLILEKAEPSTFRTEIAPTLMLALDLLGRDAFDAVLLDLALPDSAGLGSLTTVRSHAPQVPVIVLTGSSNDAIATSALRHGAQDYIVKGQFDGGSLARAIRYSITRQRYGSPSDGAPVTQGKVIGVVGAKGGVGGTTFAIHIALELQAFTGQEILLADIDLEGGTLGFLMKAQGTHSILDALQNMHRLDAAMLQSLVWKHRSGLGVLQSPAAPQKGELLPGERVQYLLRVARLQYPWIIVDLGRYISPLAALIAEFDHLYLVANPDVPSLFHAKRVLEQLRALGKDTERVHLTLNRFSESNLSVAEVKRTLGVSACSALPDATEELGEAYSAGDVLPANSVLRKRIGSIARELTGAPVTEPKKRLFRSLIRGGADDRA